MRAGKTLWREPRRLPARRIARALSGGGVLGGMCEVGAVAAIEERLG